MSRCKLYFFTEGYPFGFGEKPFVGPELEFLSQQYEVTVFATADDAKVASAEPSKLPNGVRLVRLKPASHTQSILNALPMPFTYVGRHEMAAVLRERTNIVRRLALSAYTFAQARYLRKQMRELGVFESADEALFYCYWLHHFTLAVSFEKIYGRKICIVARAHGFDLYNERIPSGRQPFQWAMRDAADKILFVSEAGRRYFAATFGGDERRYKVCHLGGSSNGTEHRAPRTHEPGTLLHLVSCSNVIPLKRIGLIAKALAALGDPDIHWTHIGEGEILGEIQSFTQERGLNASFTGRLSSAEVYRFYREQPTDAFITTSSTEGGCPVSVSEALSFGIPVIGTTVGGIPEQIDGNGILLHENPSVAEVAEAIRAIKNASALAYERMSIRSLEIWGERFDREKCVKAAAAELEEAARHCR